MEPQVFLLSKWASRCPKALAPRGMGASEAVTSFFLFCVPKKPHGLFVLTQTLTSREAGMGFLG